MDPKESTISTISNANPASTPVDTVSPVIDFFSNTLGLQGLINFLDNIWTIFAIFSYLVSIAMLVIYAYAATGKKELEDLQHEQVLERERIYNETFRGAPRNSRLVDIEKHISSDSPNDWKLAIIEADVMLDEALKEAGYAGVSLGERLRSITPNQLLSLDDAWKAHKVRNQIAHNGADFILTKRLAEDTIKQYKRTFTELGIS